MKKIKKQKLLTEEQLKSKLVSGKTLARFLHISVRTVQHYSKHMGMPKFAHGKYPLLDCARWFDDTSPYTVNRFKEVVSYYCPTFGQERSREEDV